MEGDRNRSRKTKEGLSGLKKKIWGIDSERMKRSFEVKLKSTGKYVVGFIGLYESEKIVCKTNRKVERIEKKTKTRQ